MSQTCIEPGCTEHAGTPWTKLWCQKHDEARRERITRSMEQIHAELAARERAAGSGGEGE